MLLYFEFYFVDLAMISQPEKNKQTINKIKICDDQKQAN